MVAPASPAARIDRRCGDALNKRRLCRDSTWGTRMPGERMVGTRKDVKVRVTRPSRFALDLRGRVPIRTNNFGDVDQP